MYFGPKSNICWQTIPHFPDSLSDANIVFCNPFLDSPFWQASPSVFFCFFVVCGARTPKQKKSLWMKVVKNVCGVTFSRWSVFRPRMPCSSKNDMFFDDFHFPSCQGVLEVLEALGTQNFKCKQHFSGANDTWISQQCYYMVLSY